LERLIKADIWSGIGIVVFAHLIGRRFGHFERKKVGESSAIG
jgi:hypothetical protein